MSAQISIEYCFVIGNNFNKIDSKIKNRSQDFMQMKKKQLKEKH